VPVLNRFVLDCLSGMLGSRQAHLASSHWNVWKPACTFNLGNCSLSVSSHAMVSITASYSTTFLYMQGIDTYINNWFASIGVVSISLKAYFHFLLSKTYISIIIIIKIHSASTPTVRDLNYGKIIQCASSLKLYTLFISLFDFPWSFSADQTNDNFYIFKTFGSDRTLVDALFETFL